MAMKYLLNLVTACALGSSCTAVQAANFPQKPLRFLVGYAPGGLTDTLTRLVGQRLAEMWGIAVVVDNRSGAGGIIAADTVAHSAADGYTLLMITTNHTVPSKEYERLNYDPVRSFTPLTELAYVPSLLIVHPSVPVNSVKEFVSFAKSRPNQLNFGSVGPGTSQFMNIQYFMNLAGIKMTSVNYRGNSPILVALLSNEIQLSSGSVANYQDSVKSSKLKALAISGKARSPLLPQVPTYLEAINLNGFEGGSNWYGVVAPAGMSKELVHKLHDDIVKTIKTPDVQRILSEQAVVTVAGTPEEFTNRISSELSVWSSLLKKFDIK